MEAEGEGDTRGSVTRSCRPKEAQQFVGLGHLGHLFQIRSDHPQIHSLSSGANMMNLNYMIERQTLVQFLDPRLQGNGPALEESPRSELTVFLLFFFEPHP